MIIFLIRPIQSFSMSLRALFCATRISVVTILIKFNLASSARQLHFASRRHELFALARMICKRLDK